MKWRASVFFFVWLGLLVADFFPALAITKPHTPPRSPKESTGESIVDDRAGVLSEKIQERITDELRSFSSAEGLRLVVITAKQGSLLNATGRLRFCEANAKKQFKAKHGIVVMIIPETSMVLCGYPYLPGAFRSDDAQKMMDDITSAVAGGNPELAINRFLKMIKKLFNTEYDQHRLRAGFFLNRFVIL